MGRTACIDAAALPLQLLLRRHPGWRGRPVAVVPDDTPLARLSWVNEAARRAGLLPGMRYNETLGLCRELRAAPVGAAEIEAAIAELRDRLLGFSPVVEPSRSEPGVLWADAGGLQRVQPSLAAWGRQLRAELRERLGLGATVAVGFSRFGSYAVARSGKGGVMVLPDPAAERRAAGAVALDRLGLDPAVRQRLERLGIETVGALLELPPAGVARRFGPEAAALQRFARGELDAPLVPERPRPTPTDRTDLDHPEDNAARLLFRSKRMLAPLLAELAAGQQAVAALTVELLLQDGRRRRETLRPAVPSLDAVLLSDLIRLRYDALDLDVPVVELAIEVDPAPAPPEALALFREHPRRDLAAGARALARVRAELGDDAVGYAELQPAHLPEAQWRWVPAPELAVPQPTDPGRPRLVRRIEPKPKPLNGRPVGLPADGGQHRAGWGPYLLSGGWWRREVRRAYHFHEGRDGELIWVYHDQRRRRWYLQGRVE